MRIGSISAKTVIRNVGSVVLITVQSPGLQDDAAASMTFSTGFGSVANCVNVGGQAPKLNN